MIHGLLQPYQSPNPSAHDGQAQCLPSYSLYRKGKPYNAVTQPINTPFTKHHPAAITQSSRDRSYSMIPGTLPTQEYSSPTQSLYIPSNINFTTPYACFLMYIGNRSADHPQSAHRHKMHMMPIKMSEISRYGRHPCAPTWPSHVITRHLSCIYTAWQGPHLRIRVS